MNYGLGRLATLPLSLRLLREIHAELLSGTRGAERYPGEFRHTQSWIGPSGATLAQAPSYRRPSRTCTHHSTIWSATCTPTTTCRCSWPVQSPTPSSRRSTPSSTATAGWGVLSSPCLGANGSRLTDLLFERPFLNVNLVKDSLGVSFVTAGRLIEQLAQPRAAVRGHRRQAQSPVPLHALRLVVHRHHGCHRPRRSRRRDLSGPSYPNSESGACALRRSPLARRRSSPWSHADGCDPLGLALLVELQQPVAQIRARRPDSAARPCGASWSRGRGPTPLGGGHCIVELDVQPPQRQLHEAFSWSEARNVTKTATVSLDGSSW